jgi:hypothetical protein
MLSVFLGPTSPSAPSVMGFDCMTRVRMRFFAAAILLSLVPMPAHAQGSDQKGEPQKSQPGQPGDKDTRKVDEFAEAARLLVGPAANPECVWIGRRVVNLLWRDDLDTAFRHLDLYDRFGCPGAHVQSTFRCVVRQGSIDPKAPESLGARVHQCWINPQQPPAAAAAQPTPTGQAGGGTQTQ